MLGKANGVRTEPAAAPASVRDRRRQATKDEILEAAWALVREEGLAALSLRDLAARVGMRAPSLYSYFPSKHSIYDAMFGQAATEARDMMRDRELAGDTRTQLRERARTFFEFATSDPVRAQLLFQRTIPGFEPSPESYAPAVESLDDLVQFFRSAGIDDPDALDLWTAGLSGLVSQQLANDPGGNRWGRLVDKVVDAFLTVVKPQQKTDNERKVS
jgi:AcrR family transcriptional regulator